MYEKKSLCKSLSIKTTRTGNSRLHSIEQQDDDESSDEHKHMFMAIIQSSSRVKNGKSKSN